MIKESIRQTADNGQEATGHGLKWYWLLAVAGTLLIALSIWIIVYFQFQSTESDAHKRQILAGAQGVAGQLSRLVSLRKEVLANLAADPQLSKRFQKGDAKSLRAEENRLRLSLPGVLRVRLVPVGLNVPDTELFPHMGFASMAQLRSAEQRSGVMAAEVHQFNTPHQHISFVVGVRAQGTGPLVGLIHAAFPVDDLNQALESIDDYGGRIAIRQKAPDAAPFDLVGKGPAIAEEAVPDGSLPIAGSIWQVDFWEIPQAFLRFQTGLLFGLGLVLVVLISILFLLLLNVIGGMLKRDQRSVLSLVESLVVGRPPKRVAARLRELQPMLDVLFHQLKEQRANFAKSSQPGGTSLPDSAPVAAQQADSMPSSVSVSAETVELSASIFRAYDIRGVVGETLNRNVMNLIGQSLGSEIFERGLKSIVVGRDGRESSESLQSALIAGLQASGREVIDVGLVPTPVLYFAAQELHADAGAIVTGSHNPKEYNGLKVVRQGESLSPEAIQELRRRIDAGQLLQGQGTFDSQEIIPAYIDRIVSDIRLAKPMKVVIDCGNGATAVVAPELYRQLGCDVIELFCEVDGSFPNHHPDPGVVGNMQALQQAVVENQADLGLAFDGDGDRLGVVDSSGKLIWPDRLLMYLAIDILTREPGGDIIYDVKCTRHLANLVLSNGGRPLMWKSGHSMLKAKMKETHALLAGEFSGHIIFSERWYGFDDGMYAGARLLEILALDYRTSQEVFAELPESLATPEYVVPLQEGQPRELMKKLNQQPDLPGARMVKIDGLRAEFQQGWGLVRASNTTPSLLFRFEADNQEGLDYVTGVFRDLMKTVAPALKLPF